MWHAGTNQRPAAPLRQGSKKRRPTARRTTSEGWLAGTATAVGGGRRSPTLRHAPGVSAVTASRALAQSATWSRPPSANAWRRAVRDLAYVPNQLASALASARTRTIGVVVPSLTNGVFADYLRALHDVFLPAGLQHRRAQLALSRRRGRGGDRHASRPASRGDDRRRHRPDRARAPPARAGRHSRCPDHGARRRSDRHQYRPVAARRRLCRDALSPRPRPSSHRPHRRAARPALAAAHGGLRRGHAGSRHRPCAHGGRHAARLDAWRSAASFSAICWPDAPTSRRSSAATTISRSARCSNASGAASACPTISPSSASTTSSSAPAPIPALSSVATPRYEHGEPRRRDRARDHPRFRRAPGSAPDRHGLLDRGTGEHVTRPGRGRDQSSHHRNIMPVARREDRDRTGIVPDG